MEFGVIESLDLLVFYILDETIEGVGQREGGAQYLLKVEKFLF